MTTILSNRIANLDFPMYRGEDFKLPLDFSQSDGTPIDLTGCTIEANLYRHFNSHKATFIVEILGLPTDGKVLVSLPVDQIALLPPATYSWSLFIIDSTEKRTLYCQGAVTVEVVGNA